MDKNKNMNKIDIKVTHHNEYMEYHADPIERAKLKRETIDDIMSKFDLTKNIVNVTLEYEEL